MAKEDWEIYFNAVRKQDWKTAKDFLTQITKEDRNNSQTFLKLGDICQRSGHKSEAIAAYTHAAQLLRMQGFAQKALATYKIALRLDPKNPEIIKRAEILIDEFEASKTAPHIPANIPVQHEMPTEPADPVAAPDMAGTPDKQDWIERTSLTSDNAAESSVPPITESSSLFESNANNFEINAAGQPDSQEMKSYDMPEEASSPAADEPDEGNQDWLESAIEAIDTKVFKPESERTPAQSEAGGDVISLVYKEGSSAQDDDLSADVNMFMKPLSERNERRVPDIFRDIPEDTVSGFINNLARLRFRDKQSVIVEGDAGDSMYIIISGKARVVAHILGRELELAVLNEGDLFGEVGFLTGRPRTAAVIADGPLEVYEVSRMDIETLLDTNPEIISRIEDFYEMRVKNTIRQIKK